MLILEQRVADTYSYDGTSPELIGVFSSFEEIEKALFSQTSGEVYDHKELDHWGFGSFKVRYTARMYPGHPEKYEYRKAELNQKL
jgi:hypothetical protein